MSKSILKYIGWYLKSTIPFLETVDSPAYKVGVTNQICVGEGNEKREIGIGDNTGKGLYIRPLTGESVTDKKAFSSCDYIYTLSSKARMVFYYFGNDNLDSEKIKSVLAQSIRSISFDKYQGNAQEVEIEYESSNSDFEKVYFDETGKKFEGGQWPILIAIDIKISFKNENCDPCDITESGCYDVEF